MSNRPTINPSSSNQYQEQLSFSRTNRVQQFSQVQTQIPQPQHSLLSYSSPTRQHHQSQFFNNSTTLGQSTGGVHQSSPSSNLHGLKLIDQSRSDHKINISNSNGLYYSKILGETKETEQLAGNQTETYVYRSSQPISTSQVISNRSPQIKRIQSVDRPNFAFQSTSENPIYVEKIIKIENSNTLEINQLKENNKLLQEENSKLLNELTQLRNQVPEQIEQIVFIEDLTEVRRLEQLLKNHQEIKDAQMQDAVTQQTHQLNLQIIELKKQIQTNRGKINELIEQIQLLTAALEHRNTLIKQLEDTVHSQKHEICQLREIIQEKDCQICQLQHTIANQDAQPEEYRRDLSLLTAQYDRLVQEKERILKEKLEISRGFEYQTQNLQTRNEELTRQILILQNLLKEAEPNNQHHHHHHDHDHNHHHLDHDDNHHHDHQNNNNSLLVKVFEEKIHFWSQRIKQQQQLIEELKRVIHKLETELRSQQTYCRNHHHNSHNPHNPPDYNEILKIETDGGKSPIIIENNLNNNGNSDHNNNKPNNHHELCYSKLLVKISPIEIQISQEPPAPLNTEQINSPPPRPSIEQLKFNVGQCKFQPSTFISCDKDNNKPAHSNLQGQPNGFSYLDYRQERLNERLDRDQPQEEINIEEQLITVHRISNEVQQADYQNQELQQEVLVLLDQIKEKERENDEQIN